MDYLEIVREAWRVTWRFKTLWVLGLFAGTVGGGGSWGTSNYRTDSQQVGQWASPAAAWADVSAFIHDWAPALIAGAVALVLIGLLWLVLSLAAQAGLVWEVDIAERGGQVSASDGWHEGFRRWWRVLGIGLVLILPVILLGLLVLTFAAVTLFSVLGSNSGASPTASSAWAALAGLIAIGIVSIPLFIVLSFAVGNMYLLAVRYMVLESRSPIDAIRAGWQSLRHRFKDVFLMWLITIALAIAFGIVIAIPAGILAAGIALTGYLGAWPVAVILGFIFFILLLVVMAAWNTFNSAVWTIFFRRLTGRDGRQARPVAPTYPPYPAPAPQGNAPAAPPMGGGFGPASPPPAGASSAPPPWQQPPAPPSTQPSVPPPLDPSVWSPPQSPPPEGPPSDTASDSEAR